MGRGYFCDGMPGWTYFSRAMPVTQLRGGGGGGAVKGTEVEMERHAGSGERATGRGQGWLTDACRGRWRKVDRKEGGNGKGVFL